MSALWQHRWSLITSEESAPCLGKLRLRSSLATRPQRAAVRCVVKRCFHLQLLACFTKATSLWAAFARAAWPNLPGKWLADCGNASLTCTSSCARHVTILRVNHGAVALTKSAAVPNIGTRWPAV